jgi:hypothetical protein
MKMDQMAINDHKIYHNAIKYTIHTYGMKMDQMAIKYTRIFHCKKLKNLPKFGFLVWKQTIWQPCS